MKKNRLYKRVKITLLYVALFLGLLWICELMEPLLGVQSYISATGIFFSAFWLKTVKDVFL